MGVIVTQVEGEGKPTTQVPGDMADRGVVYVLVVRGSKDMSNLRTDDASGPCVCCVSFWGRCIGVIWIATLMYFCIRV